MSEKIKSKPNSNNARWVTSVLWVVLFSLFLGFKFNNIAYAAVGATIGVVCSVLLIIFQALVIKFDSYRIRQKLPEAITSFFRKNPNIRKWLGVNVGVAIYIIASAEFLIETFRENNISSFIILLVLILFLFLAYLLSTQFPNGDGRVIQFDDVLSRLALNKWESAYEHFEKAVAFFRQYPVIDVEDCIKDGVCALEACLEIITKNPKSTDFYAMLKQLEGLDDETRIPPTIIEGLKKLYAYRGDAIGVAHANPKGSRVTEQEAELVLNLVASYVVYLSDLYAKNPNNLR